jgi:beta-glucanase (GH16 family)
MPVGNLPGWKQVYAQAFDGNSLPSDWNAFDGTPGGYSPSVAGWRSSLCSVSGGELHFMADGIHSCGVGWYSYPQTYGMYLVRMKGDIEPSTMHFSDIALLWPANNQWPPEIDFYEDSGSSRSSYMATVHPGPNGNNSGQVHVVVGSNGAQWHTYGVEWTPSTITFTIDGHPAGTAVSRSDTQSWPDIPMVLALQSQNLGGAGAPTERETMTVAWVAEYAYTPGSG